MNEIIKTAIERPALLSHVNIAGLMGMASFTNDSRKVKSEMKKLETLFLKYKSLLPLSTLSLGMSGDYQIAIECGSNMVRIGSLLFGARSSK